MKQLTKTKFPVFLAEIEGKGELVAIKYFPHNQDGSYNEGYLNEKTFHGLEHKNIVKFIDYQDDSTIDSNYMNHSALITELAKRGTINNSI